MVNHAKERLDERYHMKQAAFKDAYRKAIASKNFLIGNNKEKVGLLFYFRVIDTIYIRQSYLKKMEL